MADQTALSRREHVRSLARPKAFTPWLFLLLGIYRLIDHGLNLQQLVEDWPWVRATVGAHPHWTTAGLILAGFAWLGYLVTRPLERLAEGLPDAREGRDASWQWLTRRAESELRNGLCPLIVWRHEAEYCPGREPYIDFQLTLYNGSAWPIAIGEVRGYAAADGQELKTPDLVRGPRKQIEAQNAEVVKLRQWLGHAHDYSDARFDLSRLDVRIVKNPDAEHGMPRGEDVPLYVGALTSVTITALRDVPGSNVTPTERVTEDPGPPTLSTKQEQDAVLGRTEFYLLVNNPGATARFQFQITAFPGSAKDWAVRWFAHPGETKEVIAGRSATLHVCRLDLGYAERERLEATLGKLGRAGLYPPHPRLVFYTPSGEEIGFRYEDVTGLEGDALYLPDTCTVFQGELISADTGRSRRFLINLGINPDDLSIRSSVHSG